MTTRRSTRGVTRTTPGPRIQGRCCSPLSFAARAPTCPRPSHTPRTRSPSPRRTPRLVTCGRRIAPAWPFTPAPPTISSPRRCSTRRTRQDIPRCCSSCTTTNRCDRRGRCARSTMHGPRDMLRPQRVQPAISVSPRRATASASVMSRHASVTSRSRRCCCRCSRATIGDASRSSRTRRTQPTVRRRSAFARASTRGASCLRSTTTPRVSSRGIRSTCSSTLAAMRRATVCRCCRAAWRRDKRRGSTISTRRASLQSTF